MLKAVFLAGALALAAPDIADAPVRIMGGTIRVVSLEGVDLSTAAGQSMLDRRVARAVKSLCAIDPAFIGSGLEPARAECVEATSATARDQIKALVASLNIAAPR